MAKHVILENYTFTPSTKTVVVNGKAIRREQLVLITEVTTNTVIYNFADTALTASTYTVSTANNVETTTIILTYNTTSMNPTTSKLMIIVDETNETFYPAEALMDSNTKLRTSAPQSLIDTDFEYGTQPTKWETMSLLNNRPSAFYDYTGAITLTGISGAGTRTVTVTYSGSPAVTPTVNTPVFIQDSTDYNANGWYLISSTGAGTFTYTAKANVTNGSIFDATKTYVFMGVFYTGAAITVSASAGAAFTNSGTTVTGTTTYNHGLSVGDAIYVVGTTATTNAPNGAWFVKTTPTTSTFTFDVISAPTGTITATNGATATLYARPWGNAVHRPFDGGVYFTAGAPYHGNQLIRQTRRYFRYQSGKGMMFSTGSCMTSPFITDSITSAGTTTCTVTTKFPHNLWTGATIKVTGASPDAYNGVFVVVSVPTDITFTYTALSIPSSSPAYGNFSVQPDLWYGATVRIGMFDQQNGFYWEYDGQTISVNRRSSTVQLAGAISSLASGGQAVTGTNTQFSKQLSPGDFVVIRGMSHTVVSIESDTAMTVYPEYRGTTITSPSLCIISRTDTLKIPQSSFNIDKLDGTGASGYNLDITKMQMWLIDYSWYGAGAIRFGVKNARGEFIYAHRIAHGNLMTEAYMRSGNLPGRYEVNTIAPYTKLTATLANTEVTSMTVASTTGFPPSGTLVLQASGNTGATIEYINYTAKTATTFTGLTRAVTNLTGPQGLTGGGGTGTAATFTVTSASASAPAGVSPTAVTYFSPQCSNTISHWGSSVIMDGRYDDDKSIQFNYGMTTAVTYTTAGTRYPVFSIRLAPTVDSGLTGILGARELINRMQLQPVGMGCYTTTAGVRVELWLNAKVTGGTFGPVGGSSLAQYVQHANTQTMSGGESIYTFIAPAGGVSTQDLSKMRDIGNSIVGGGNTLNYPTTDNNKYPDGPDILTVAVIPLASNASVIARMSWTEAQA
jgi:hypothetical protein